METRGRTDRRRRRAGTRRSRPALLLRAVLVAFTLASTIVFGAVVFGNATGRFRLAPVLSGSMEPTYPTGSLVVAAPVPSDEVRVGDVLLFNAPTAGHPLTMHRIHEAERGDGGARVLVTKGDANDAPDAWKIKLKGATAWRVVHHIPKAGTVLGWLTGVSIRMIVLVGGVLVFLLAGLSVVWGKGPISWKAHDPHGVIRRRQRKKTTRRAIAITSVGTTTVAALALAGLAGAQFTATPTPPQPPVASTALDAPTNVNVTWTPGVQLTWTAPSSPRADGVRVFRSTASGGPYTQIAQIEGLGTTAYDDSPGAGTWYYVLRSKYTGGSANWESADSAQVARQDSTFVFKSTTSFTGTNCLIGAPGNSSTSRDMQQGFSPSGPQSTYGGRWTTIDFCSNTFTTGQSLPAGTTTAYLYMTNTGNNDCGPVVVRLLKNGTSLGSTSFTASKTWNSPTLATLSFATGATSFSTGDRLVLRVDQPNDPHCNKTDVHWNTASLNSRVTVPTMT